MLRPFNFNTLATLVYESASRARVQDAALPALVIIAAGLVPSFSFRALWILTRKKEAADAATEFVLSTRVGSKNTSCFLEPPALHPLIEWTRVEPSFGQFNLREG